MRQVALAVLAVRRCSPIPLNGSQQFDQSFETCSDFRRIVRSLFAVALSCGGRQAGAALIASAISQIA